MKSIITPYGKRNIICGFIISYRDRRILIPLYTGQGVYELRIRSQKMRVMTGHETTESYTIYRGALLISP